MSAVSLEALKFDNSFVRELPGDPNPVNEVRQVFEACYSAVKPTAVSDPTLVAWSPEVADLLDLPGGACRTKDFAQVLSGNRLVDGMSPYAACYGGHQFGNWAGQLGDGRAITLGEIVNEAGQRWELQLKGAGPTPYSRGADGRAVLRSSIREFLCSEAMYHLGVPTTRALSLVTTGDPIWRDMFYDGHPAYEPGAVVCRVSPSFVRFGSFQLFASRRDTATLQTLVGYVMRTHFPELGPPSVESIGAWYAEICRRTAEMVVHWMRVGFVHGVMNTDNMSILGLTIDYGPYGWVDDFDPDWTPNTTDFGARRYRFGQQPHIALWNLVQLGNALVPLVGEVGPLQVGVDAYRDHLATGSAKMMAEKLGISSVASEGDQALVASMNEALVATETDMTLFFRSLATVNASDENPFPKLEKAFYAPPTPAVVEQWTAWLKRYRARVAQDGVSDPHRAAAMNRVNPLYVMRNYLAQEVIDKAEAGDLSGVGQLLDVMREPYTERPGLEHFAQRRPEWARDRPGCSTLSCSS